MRRYTLRLGPKCIIIANSTFDRTEYAGIAQHKEWVLAEDADRLEREIYRLEREIEHLRCGKPSQ